MLASPCALVKLHTSTKIKHKRSGVPSHAQSLVSGANVYSEVALMVSSEVVLVCTVKYH